MKYFYKVGAIIDVTVKDDGDLELLYTPDYEGEFVSDLVFNEDGTCYFIIMVKQEATLISVSPPINSVKWEI